MAKKPKLILHGVTDICVSHYGTGYAPVVNGIGFYPYVATYGYNNSATKKGNITEEFYRKFLDLRGMGILHLVVGEDITKEEFFKVREKLAFSVLPDYITHSMAKRAAAAWRIDEWEEERIKEVLL